MFYFLEVDIFIWAVYFTALPKCGSQAYFILELCAQVFEQEYYIHLWKELVDFDECFWMQKHKRNDENMRLNHKGFDVWAIILINFA